MDTKVCSICKVEKELSEYYSYNKNSKTKGDYIYYNPECKECTKKRSRNRDLDNYEEYLAYKSEYNKQYFNKPENKLRHREIVRKSREKGYNIKWQRSNPDKVKVYNEKRQNKNHKISTIEWEDCKKYFNHRCAYCGIAIEEHIIVFRGKTQLGDFHKEHVDDDGAADLSNCVPSCKNCNSQKKNYKFEEWYNEDNERFTLERLEKIHNWLNRDYTKYIKFNS